jgi:sphingolipid delta-4 desaturase
MPGRSVAAFNHVAKKERKFPRTASEAEAAGTDTYRANDKDYIWSTRQQPHTARNKQLRAKYGKQIRALHTLEKGTAVKTLVYLSIVLGMSVATRELSWPLWLLAAYPTGIFTHSMFLAVHEITHNLVFKTVLYNDLLSMVANWAMVVPYSMTFKSYHAEHHHYQGWDGVDVDIPSRAELFLLQSKLGKLVFLTFQTLFYAFRPMCLRTPKLSYKNALNWVIVCGFDYVWFQLWGPIPLLFILACVITAGMPSPVSGHFLSEHFIFDTKHNRQETYSYYGWWNCIAFDVGFHNEHHDFPGIPGCKLRELKALAPEFYDHLDTTPSWFGVAWEFLMSDTVSMSSRVKREANAGKRSELIPTQPEDASAAPVHS